MLVNDHQLTILPSNALWWFEHHFLTLQAIASLFEATNVLFALQFLSQRLRDQHVLLGSSSSRLWFSRCCCGSCLPDDHPQVLMMCSSSLLLGSARFETEKTERVTAHVVLLIPWTLLLWPGLVFFLVLYNICLTPPDPESSSHDYQEMMMILRENWGNEGENKKRAVVTKSVHL